MPRVVLILIVIVLAAWLLVWAGWPDYQAELVSRAGWILLMVFAWWLAGRVIANQ